MLYAKPALGNPPAEAEHQSPEQVRSPLPGNRSDDQIGNDAAGQKRDGDACDNERPTVHPPEPTRGQSRCNRNVGFPPISDISCWLGGTEALLITKPDSVRFNGFLTVACHIAWDVAFRFKH